MQNENQTNYDLKSLFPQTYVSPSEVASTEPLTLKNNTSSPKIQIFDCAVHREQGSRDHQEDRYMILNNFQDKGYAYFAVYDGHHNELFSSHAAKHLHNHILESEEFARGQFADAIRNGFYLEDKQTFEELVKQKRQMLGGSTAVVAIVIANSGELWVGDAGDSRVVLAQQSKTYGACDENLWYDALRITHDHKPTESDEKERIIESGGTVTHGRARSY